MTEAPARTYSLLTFAPMIDSELCRFILTHYAEPYRELPHTFGRDGDQYNRQLAGQSAVLAYFHLLPHREIMVEPSSAAFRERKRRCSEYLSAPFVACSPSSSN
jgi:hypothetical protein